MPDRVIEVDPYSMKFSPKGKESRNGLPRDMLPTLLNLMDELAADPEAFPGRVSPLGRDGKVRLYCHPSPPLEITFEVDTKRRVLYFCHFVAPKAQITKPVFISYSRKDAEWLSKLKKFLKPLEDKDQIRVWDDTEIRVGADWLGEIQKALNSAQVAVFLVTQDFLLSPFIASKELPVLLDAAKTRGCLIFVIEVSSTTLADTELARFQSANSPEHPLDLMSEPEQNKALKTIYDKMKAAVSNE
jgi:hypothetical protein